MTLTNVGYQALKSVLQRFNVKNRDNMYIIKEKSGGIFYLSLNEINGNGLQSIIISKHFSLIVNIEYLKLPSNELEK